MFISVDGVDESTAVGLKLSLCSCPKFSEPLIRWKWFKQEVSVCADPLCCLPGGMNGVQLWELHDDLLSNAQMSLVKFYLMFQCRNAADVTELCTITNNYECKDDLKSTLQMYC